MRRRLICGENQCIKSLWSRRSGGEWMGKCLGECLGECLGFMEVVAVEVNCLRSFLGHYNKSTFSLKLKLK